MRFFFKKRIAENTTAHEVDCHINGALLYPGVSESAFTDDGEPDGKENAAQQGVPGDREADEIPLPIQQRSAAG